MEKLFAREGELTVETIPMHPDAKAIILEILRQNNAILQQNGRLLAQLDGFLSSPLMEVHGHPGPDIKVKI